MEAEIIKNEQAKGQGIKCLTPMQISKILCMSKTEVYRLFHAKEFPSFRLGEKMLRVTEEDFYKWLDCKIAEGK